MLTMLIAYDAAGNVVATLDHMVARDDRGEVIGLLDFEAHETAGGKLRNIWQASEAAGSATWPEWIGGRALEFRVELDAEKRIRALIHKDSGIRRERAAIEAAINSTEVDAEGRRDIRHIVGGPTRPLILDDEGRTIGRSIQSTGTPAHLPLIGLEGRAADPARRIGP